MKKLFSLLLRIFGKKAKYDLDRDGKIESLRDELAGVLSAFKVAHDETGRIIDELEDVINEANVDNTVLKEELHKHIIAEEAKIDRNIVTMEKAKAEIEANKALQKTLKQFTL